MRSSQKTLAIWLVLFVVGILFFQMYEQQKQQKITDFDYPRFLQALKAKEIKSITFNEEKKTISGVIKKEFESKYKGKKFTIFGNTGSEGFKLVKEQGIIPKYESPKDSFLLTLLVSWLPLIIIIFMFFFFMKQLQAGGGKALNFGKTKAKLVPENRKNKITFKDVAGIEEAKEELQEVVEFLKNPKKFTRLGGKMPKGILLVGSPGTGKTLLAKAVAGEANVPFFTISGSDFVEMFVGVGASRVRDLFEQSKKNAPCIVFIDEIDAVGRHRGAGMGGGHDEREQTLNQLLVEMDGFEGTEGIILLAGTNRPDVLDPALLRPGRFDRRVVVNKPDIKGREQILKVHTKKTPLSSHVDLSLIAKGTPGFSGADLANLVNESALIAARANKNKVDMFDLEQAKDKVMMGSERRSMMVNKDDLRVTAFHEAGHTIVGKSLEHLDPVHKVTIVPRGMALGVTQTVQEKESLSISKARAENMIAFLFGGRAAEELVFKNYTAGASNDIERATDLARSMVCEWGMSEKLGPIALEKREGPVFLGIQQSQKQREHSDAKSREIDEEVDRLISQGYKKAKEILDKKKDILDTMSEALLEYETLDGTEISMLMEGKGIADLKDYREKLEKKLDKENKEAKDNKKEKKIDPSKDPVGNPGSIPA